MAGLYWWSGRLFVKLAKEMKQKKLVLRVATYNTHKCRGLDGRVDAVRISSVLKSLKADVIALQEVVGPSPKKAGQEEVISMKLNMQAQLASGKLYHGHLYGNVILSRLPMTSHVIYDLTQTGHEPRICQRADITLEGHVIHIYNVHLGLSMSERLRQARRIMSVVLGEQLHGPKIVLGDFNEWNRGPATDYLKEKLRSIDLRPHLKWRKTYPGLLPIFHLDHIYHTGHVEIHKLYVPRGLKALIASDHLPLVADLEITVREKSGPAQ
jgi:endonuclease/exonuclease/phosphatase family metal-dependent hydrolase